MMGASDVLDFLLGIAWAVLPFPYMRWAWLFSRRAFEPLQSDPPLWSRCLVCSLLALVLVFSFSTFGVLLYLKLPPSKLEWNPAAAGVITGLILFVLAVLGGSKCNSK
jgi:hypothetical protein